MVALKFRARGADHPDDGVLVLEHLPKLPEDVVDGTGGSVIDRRTIIKRAAAGGALAWTAPVILDSLASPAGAITCTSDCVRLQFPPNDTGCSLVRTQTVNFICPTTSPECSTTPAGVRPGLTLGDVCLVASTFCTPTFHHTFTGCRPNALIASTTTLRPALLLAGSWPARPAM
jgi:hypothetical protein